VVARFLIWLARKAVRTPVPRQLRHCMKVYQRTARLLRVSRNITLLFLKRQNLYVCDNAPPDEIQWTSPVAYCLLTELVLLKWICFQQFFTKFVCAYNRPTCCVNAQKCLCFWLHLFVCQHTTFLLHLMGLPQSKRKCQCAKKVDALTLVVVRHALAIKVNHRKWELQTQSSIFANPFCFWVLAHPAWHHYFFLPKARKWRPTICHKAKAAKCFQLSRRNFANGLAVNHWTRKSQDASISFCS